MPRWDWHVTLVDENGTAVSVGGGTQYADGATQANPTGNVALWLDTSDVLRAASAAKPLPVAIISGAGGSQTDASAWTTAVTSFAPGGGVFNDSATDLTAGQQGTLRMTAKRAQHINLRNASAAEIGIAAAPLISAGNLTNNNAVPAATNYGSLTALANAVAPSITEGRQTLLSTDLAGGLRALIPQLPTAAALSDATANPTTVMIGAATMGWDSAAWERATLINGSSDARGNSASVGLVGHALNYIYNGTSWDRARGNTTGMFAHGNVAHDGVDAGNPNKMGARAIAHGTNPTAVSAADRTDLYANLAGIPFHIGGHPNVITRRDNFTTAQTDTALVTVAGGLKIVVTGFMVTADNANTVNVSCVIGFGAANTPTGAGVIGAHPGIGAGSGFGRGGGSGMIGVGADGEDLRVTSSVPTGGSITVVTTYYTIES